MTKNPIENLNALTITELIELVENPKNTQTFFKELQNNLIYYDAKNLQLLKDQFRRWQKNNENELKKALDSADVSLRNYHNEQLREDLQKFYRNVVVVADNELWKRTKTLISEQEKDNYLEYKDTLIKALDTHSGKTLSPNLHQFLLYGPSHEETNTVNKSEVLTTTYEEAKEVVGFLKNLPVSLESGIKEILESHLKNTVLKELDQFTMQLAKDTQPEVLELQERLKAVRPGKHELEKNIEVLTKEHKKSLKFLINRQRLHAPIMVEDLEKLVHAQTQIQKLKGLATHFSLADDTLRELNQVSLSGAKENKTAVFEKLDKLACSLSNFKSSMKNFSEEEKKQIEVLQDVVKHGMRVTAEFDQLVITPSVDELWKSDS